MFPCTDSHCSMYGLTITSRYRNCFTTSDFPIQKKPLCSFTSHPSRKPWCIKKPFPTISASWSKLKNPLITLVILQYYETSSGLISIYHNVFQHAATRTFSALYTWFYSCPSILHEVSASHVTTFWALLVSAICCSFFLQNFPN